MMRFKRKAILSFLLSAAVALSVAPNAKPVRAAVINVGCSATDLVNAVTAANATTADDTLQLTTNCTYAMTTGGSNNSALPTIANVPAGGRLTINGGIGVIIQRDPALSTPEFRLMRTSGDDANVTISNVTIRNFRLGEAGGAIVTTGILNLVSVTFEDNEAEGDRAGGAIYQASGVLNISYSTFNRNSSGAGGAVYSVSTTNITGSYFNYNNSRGDAGAVYIGSGTTTITGTTFYRNSADNAGGAVHNAASINFPTVTILDSVFSENNSGNYAGAIDHFNGNMTIRRTTFYNNQTADTGGAMYVNAGNIVISDSTFSQNASAYGGALGIRTTTQLSNSTLIYNSASTEGGAIWLYSGRSLNMANSTIVGNSAPTGGGVFREGTGTFNIDNNVIALNNSTTANPDISGAVSSGSFNNFIGNGTGATGITNGVSGNQVGTSGAPLNPLLTAPTSNGGSTVTLRPLPNSPLINAGSNPSAPAGTIYDQRYVGHPRIVNGTIDIGAYELQREDNPGLYNSGNAAFLLRTSLNAGVPTITFLYGSGGADIVALTGDWDGDGIDTQGIYVRSSGVFVLSNVLNGGAFAAFPYGPGGNDYLPLVGDWNGDGRDTVGIYNRTNGLWLLIDTNASVAPTYTFFYGSGGSLVPIPGDWDGNGSDTPGVYNPTNGAWILSNNLNAPPFAAFPYGENLYPVKGDWDRDGKDSPGVYSTAAGSWLLINQTASIAPQLVFNYGGGSTLVPLVGRWVNSSTAPIRENDTPTDSAPQIAPTFAP